MNQQQNTTETQLDQVDRFPTYLSDAAWVAVFIICSASIQLLMPYPFDADTGYHFAVGQLIREHGILHSFPWTPFSWLADKYADKELLFHLIFVPFANLDYITASRIVGTICCTGILSAIYLILRIEKVRMPGLWSLLPLAVSASFIFRFALVRPHLLSITLALLLLWSAVRRRLWLLAVVSLVYPWAYVAFWQIPLLILGAAEAGRFFHCGRIEWKTMLVAVAGLAIGVVLHPNADNLLQLNWIQMSVLFQNAWGGKAGFDLGTEFLPPPPAIWGQRLILAVIMTSYAVVVGWSDRKRDPMPLVFALAAVIFGLLTSRTIRFVEYFAPLAVVSLALVSRGLKWRFFPAAVLAAAIIYTAAFGQDTYMKLTRRGNDIPPSLTKKLADAIPPGAQVFTPDWRMTGTFMVALPDRRFIVALDPTFFYMKDPELYNLWFSISRNPTPDLTSVLRSKFNARYVLFFDNPSFIKLREALLADPNTQLLLRTRIMYLFDIGAQDVSS